MSVSLLRHERRIDLRETGIDLQVDHPRDERALQRRAGAAQHVEARARQLRAARDVEDAERLADLPVRLRRERSGSRFGSSRTTRLSCSSFSGRRVRGDRRSGSRARARRARPRADRAPRRSPLICSPTSRIRAFTASRRRTALARLVSLGLEQLLLRPQLAAALVELEDAVERRLEVTRREHRAHAVGVLADRAGGGS